MKKLEISRLMDEYQDDEFFPEGGTTADTQAVKELVLAKAAPAGKRRRMSSLKTALLAAALAVGCMLMMGAGLAMISVVSPSGIGITLDERGEHQDHTQYNDRWLVVENGRFFLEFGGKRTEITGKFDADTPYIHTVTDPTGITFHYVVGGTAENYGYTEFEIVPDHSRGEVSPHNAFVRFDAQGEPMLDENLWDGNGNLLYSASDRLSDFDDSYRVYRDGNIYILEWYWYTAACEQLGFKGFFAP